MVGFITAAGDGVLASYIPLLEVLPDYQRRGIGTELVRRMLVRLGDRYMVDLACDEDVAPFYETSRATGITSRSTPTPRCRPAKDAG